jgi:AhpD family alkylhydroperoxidase
VEQPAGVVHNVMRALSNHPGAAQAIGQLAAAGYLSTNLTPTQRELAYLTASTVNRCHYWVPTHVVLGLGAGIPREKLAHVGDDPLPTGVYSPDEAAIIRYARASTRLEPITDGIYGPLAAHFDTQQLIEICMTVGLSNLINRFHATFLTDLDESTAEAYGESGLPDDGDPPGRENRHWPGG